MSDLPIFTRKADEEIERLRAENEALKQRAEQAERERDEAVNSVGNCAHCGGIMGAKERDKRDIEQQIKVLAWLLDNREQERERVDGFGYDAVISSFDVEQKIVELRAQLEGE